MRARGQKPLLFFDFDNTITLGDVLDAIVERYSATDAWRGWEAAWQEGRISTEECLLRQIGDLRVSQQDLLKFVASVPIDPSFAKIVAWAGNHGVELAILSDNFSMLIREILDREGLGHVPVFANELTFIGDRPNAHFPLKDTACSRCAHCKGQHLRHRDGFYRIFIGDGLSDVCAALVADKVFAKDSLAIDLAKRGRPYTPYRSLAEVLRYLETQYGS
jgi:2-hydroxy-3-keto-5-methylthiopentenyl-1-phosphate phosphatase